LSPSLSPTPKVSQGVCTPNNILKVATDGSYPPFETFAPQQQASQFSGFDIDLLTAIAKNQGLNVSFTNEDFSTIFVKLTQGEYTAVISGATITEERTKVVDFSSPYFTTGPSVFIRKTDANKYKTLASLAGQKIGVQTGTLNTLVTEKINGAVIKEYNLARDMLRALSNKEIEAVMLDSATGLNLITEQKLALMIAVRNITSENYGIAVRKDCPEVLSKINAGLQAIISNGTYNIGVWTKRTMQRVGLAPSALTWVILSCRKQETHRYDNRSASGISPTGI
jgi:ABC-type amino acid transport substrate-binding protein